MPGLPDYALWIWRAWDRLSDERPWRSGGMGPPTPGRIPWTAVRQWAAHHGYDADRMTVLEAGIAVMDAVYMQHWGEVVRRTAGGDKP